ncbi:MULTISPECIES: HIT family protein [unclassified Kaistella]|uniref:HIT family protein n=1 Tax=unclassified Kaistella TaxID=2762626 RepID=UPI0027375DE4|nr:MULTISPECIES: HIT family protein [unclassified Kaistella]MDP2454192.1 HIT family protein [Kaistella sp. SH11-4b]MDP2457737.1 HIT family protein [Kaistella sp. SH40-3]MDP2460495.1 HIT family protein [Kaistella sp. SH19-2b]
MGSIFTKIVQGEIPSYTIAEDEKHLAFLDMMPLVKGHCLVIPKREVDLIFDLENEDFKDLWSFAQKVAKKMEKAYPERRVALAVVGLEVPHAHIHLIPIHKMEDMNFKNERLKFSDEEYLEIQQHIINS